MQNEIKFFLCRDILAVARNLGTDRQAGGIGNDRDCRGTLKAAGGTPASLVAFDDVGVTVVTSRVDSTIGDGF